MVTRTKATTTSRQSGKVVNKVATPKTVEVEAPKKSKFKEFKPPKSIAACADLCGDTRTERLATNKVVEELKSHETILKEYLINNVSKSDATGAVGKRWVAHVELKEVVTVEDKAKLIAYAIKKGELDLLQIGVNDAAVKLRWERKVKVPGVKPLNIPVVSITKR